MELTHTNPYIYSPELRDDVFCFGLNFNISKSVYLLKMMPIIGATENLGPTSSVNACFVDLRWKGCVIEQQELFLIYPET